MNSEINIFDLCDFEHIRDLGSGAYSKVSLEKNKKTGEIVAIKTFSRPNYDDRYEADFMKEISILGTIRHPCIISFYGFSAPVHEENLILSYAFEYMEGGSLSDLLDSCFIGSRPDNFGGTEKTIIAIGIASALRYLHDIAIHNGSIIHRDIKSSNVLLDANYRPKLSDFGFAKVIHEEEHNTPRRGSYPWMAPEVMSSSTYGKSCDVYAFGMFLYELVSEHIPFVDAQTTDEIVHRVTEDKERPILPDHDKKICEIIQKCWDEDPHKRPSFDKIVGWLIGGLYSFDGTDYEHIRTYVNEHYLELAKMRIPV